MWTVGDMEFLFEGSTRYLTSELGELVRFNCSVMWSVSSRANAHMVYMGRKLELHITLYSEVSSNMCYTANVRKNVTLPCTWTSEIRRWTREENFHIYEQTCITFFKYINILLSRRSRLNWRYKRRTRCHSSMALNSASAMSAAAWLSQTRVKIDRNFSSDGDLVFVSSGNPYKVNQFI